MRILFVDDDPRILEGIERMLFHLEDWDISCADSGSEALEELAQDDYDVIVTDMRMPGMDGAELLRRVHRDHPSVVRLVLSGHAELEAALRAVPVAHQFLAKPCKAKVLEEAVERACGLQTLLNDPAVRSVVGKIDKLPSVPRVYAELTRALVDPDTDAEMVSDIILQDSAMSAKVLQLVNSAFFGRRVAISSIRQAVVHLGFRMVKNLALSVEVFSAATLSKQVKGFSIERHQAHANHCAALAAAMFDERRASDDAFLAAMFHDIGKLILATELPQLFSKALADSQREQVPLYQAEVVCCGVSHAELGAYLLGLWGMPYPIVEAVANHHQPSRVGRSSTFGVLEAVYVANGLSTQAALDRSYLAAIGVQDRLDDWAELSEKLRDEAS